MFNIKKEDIAGTTNKLLFNIWQELRKDVKPVEINKENKLCEHCGKDHSNKGYAMACSRKLKKDGAK